MSKNKTKTIKYGKIEIEINDNKSPYTPQNGGNFIDHGEILKTLAIGIKNNLPVLLIGESGTGKTSAVRFLASQTNNGLRRINLNGGTTADELVGRLLIDDKGTYWIDGVLTEAMRKGEWIVLDEINAALPEVLFVLQSIMDDDGYLVLNEKNDKEIVYKHPNFRIFATCNPPEYAGTKEMNKALLSRFAICINAEFPPEKKELEIIEHHLGNAIAISELAIKLVGLARETRKTKELGTTDYAINTRDVLNTLRLSKFMEPIEAMGLAFSNKLDSADNKALKTIARLHLPSNKKKTITTKPIKTADNLKIGNTYTMNADMHNVYLGLTDVNKNFNELIEKELPEIITETIKNNAIKGDQFIIEGIFYEYEKDRNGLSKITKDNMGANVASVIKIIEGPNKNKRAIIIHHKGLNGTLEIIKNINENN